MSPNQPPPIYAPQPSNSGGSPGLRPVVWILIAIPFAILFLILFAAATYLVFARQKPRERPGTHNPVTVTKMKRGWAWYYMRPIGVAIACTAPPEPVDFEQTRVARRADISEFAGYRFRGKYLNTRIYAYWMRNGQATMESQANYTQRNQKIQIKHVTKIWQEPVVVAGLPGRMVVCEYPSKGYLSVNKTALVMVGNVTYFFEGTYFKVSEKWANTAFSYELRTAHIDR